MKNKLTLLFLFVLFTQSICAQEAQIWKRYKGEITNSNIPVLPDYSYAGYKLGLEAIPNTHTGKIFNVTNYGAIANDNKSDQAAIQAAIDAAEANKGGVVLFPPGEFLVNTTTSNQKSITIDGANIVLKGSGSTNGGTIINMKNYMRNAGGSPWGTPSMIRFNGSGGSRKSSDITANAKRGDISVKVQNASIFVGKKYARLILNKSKPAIRQFTDGKPLRNQWGKIKGGVEAKQFHEIASVNISANIVTFKSVIMDDINTSFPWKLETHNLAENCGFEDIHFKANFTEDFKHHSSYIHDYAWDAIDMSRLANSWVRRVRFTNVTMGVKMVGSYSCSLLQIYADGNSGHNLTAVEYSSNVLQGLMHDNTSKGIWHGCDMSGQAAGCVVWRIGGTKSRGFDLHAAQPRTNLIDLYESNRITGNGGNFKNLPNHLTGLTIWNQKRTGRTESNDFWDFCSGNYCGLTVANPIIVGYHGSATTLSDVKYEESKGTKVQPESLYEAQLEHRLGTKPAWINAAIQEFDALINIWTGNNTANLPPTVSFSNLPAGNTYQAGISLLPIANAQDVDGTVAKVSLYINDILVREETAAPYEWGHLAEKDAELKNMAPGNYTLKATATDNKGASTDTIFIFTIGTANNLPPTVSFSNLPTGNTYQAGISLLPIADAQDADGAIAKVALYLNDVLVREKNGAPYEWGHLADKDAELKNMAPGNYTLKATATDDNGASTDAVFTFAVTLDNLPPTVSFSNLPTGNTYQAGIRLLPIADAQDADGAVAKVALYLNDVLVREERVAPYEWGHLTNKDNELKNMTAGNYTIKATATDNKGASTEVVFTFTVQEQEIMALSPIHDAYIQGRTGVNNANLRVENGRRTTYLMFDLSNLPEGVIEQADLKLTVSNDAGNGTIRIYEGKHNNWQERSLNASNAATLGSELVNSSGSLKIGTTYSYDVMNAEYSGKYVTFIVKQDAGGNDVSFASKENNNSKPQLTVKINQDVLRSSTAYLDKDKVIAFPNPTIDVVNLTRKSEWILYAINGLKLDSGFGSKIDIKTYLEGLYIIKLKNHFLKIQKKNN